MAAVNGAALGGGCGLVAACDIAVAMDKAVFGFTEVPMVLGGLDPCLSEFRLNWGSFQL